MQPTNATQSRPVQSQNIERPQPGTLQKLMVLWFIGAAFMLTLGRSFLGSGGWMTILYIFTVAPFLSFYGLFVSAIVYVRWKKTGYVFSRWMKAALGIFLVATGVHSVTLVDGGDTNESINSVLTNVMGVNGQNGMDSPLMNLSNSLANVSKVVIVVTLVAMLLLAFLDGRRVSKKSH